jgi:hypothetical protein
MAVERQGSETTLKHPTLNKGKNAMWIASRPSAFVTAFLVGLVCGFALGVSATRGHAAETFFSVGPQSHSAIVHSSPTSSPNGRY